jgi:hypothetical protein
VQFAAFGKQVILTQNTSRKLADILAVQNGEGGEIAPAA